MWDAGTYRAVGVEGAVLDVIEVDGRAKAADDVEVAVVND